MRLLPNAEGMLDAAEPTMQDFGYACKVQTGPFPTQADIFNVMIDAALKEKPNEVAP